MANHPTIRFVKITNLAKIATFLLNFIACITVCHAHTPEQFAVDFSTKDGHWYADIRFDASYALPSMRDDRNSPPKKHAWLVNQSPAMQTLLRQEAEKYLEETITLLWNDSPVEYNIQYPNWDTDPPVFELKDYDMGNAFFRIVYTGKIPEGNGSLTLDTVAESPDYLILYPNSDYITILSGERGTLYEIKDETPQGHATKHPFLSFLGYGFDHVIPKGLDHILFIIAVALYPPIWARKKSLKIIRSLVTYSLLFTLAHSVTLALISLDILRISDAASRWIEITIAASIAFLAIENILMLRKRNLHTEAHDGKKALNYRILTIFFFGLVHGMGFGSVLFNFFSQTPDKVIPLVAANLGIECAQVLIIILTALIFVVLEDFLPKPWLLLIPSASIATIALLWVAERSGF